MSKNTSWKDVVCPEGYVALRCKNCHKIFVIKSDVPLNQQVPNHTWYGEHGLRHLTREDWLEEQAEKELCSVCGAYHPGVDTGCHLILADKQSKEAEK